MISVYTLEQSDKWDELVKQFENYDVYYLSGYVKAFMIHGDGEPVLFYYESEDADAKAINVVMKRDIGEFSPLKGLVPLNTWFDYSCPYGYGGWLFYGDVDDKILFEEYDKYLHSHNVVSEFVRFHPVLENHVYSEHGYDVIPLGQVITMDLASPEIIWENIISKNRNMIRKAIKNGVTIKEGSNSELYKTFRAIYNKTMDKDEADSYYYFGDEFYESIMSDLKDNAKLFYAEYEGNIIAASIMIYANGRMNYHLSGSVREYQNLAPTNLLLYQAALWGCENGYKTLYLGGGVGSGEDSLFKFKRAFYRKDDLKRFYIGKKIINKEKYDELVSLRTDLPDSGYFPRYRAMH